MSKYNKFGKYWKDICIHEWYPIKNPKAKPFSFTNEITEPDNEPTYIKKCKYCGKVE